MSGQRRLGAEPWACTDSHGPLPTLTLLTDTSQALMGESLLPALLSAYSPEEEEGEMRGSQVWSLPVLLSWGYQF